MTLHLYRYGRLYLLAAMLLLSLLVMGACDPFEKDFPIP